MNKCLVIAIMICIVSYEVSCQSLTGAVVVLYGDSLTIQTRDATRSGLLAAGVSEVRYIEDYPDFVASHGGSPNGGNSARALDFVETVDLSDVDFVVMNCGIHDMTRNPTEPRLRQQTEEEYEINLKAIYAILGDKLIWRETFQTSGIIEGESWDEDDVERYNLVARAALPGVKRVTGIVIPDEVYDADGIHLLDGVPVGEEVARQVVEGEVLRSVSLEIGTVITLDQPAVVGIDPLGDSVRIKAPTP